MNRVSLSKLAQNLINKQPLPDCIIWPNNIIAPPLPMTETTVPTKKSYWIWNALTVTCLVISGTFVTNTLHAFSQNGLDLLQTFGAISQGAGLLLLTGGTLTDKGRQVITDMLTTFKVPPSHQAEGTFVLALTVLIVTGIINFSLPLLGEYYYQRGQSEYKEGKLAAAKVSFEEAAHFVREETEINDDINVALGNVYETSGYQLTAKPYYEVGAAAGNPAALNGLGRVQLRIAWTYQDFLLAETSARVGPAQPELDPTLKADMLSPLYTTGAYQDFLLAETSFRVGLAQPELDPTLKAEMLSHLGITLIKQAEVKTDREGALYKEAEKVLKQGVALDKTLTERTPGIGLSHCYMAILHKKLKLPQQWQACIDNALPTSFDQFRDIMFYAEPGIAEKINTTGIVKAEE